MISLMNLTVEMTIEN